MKRLFATLLVALFATTASADMLSRWEVAENAISDRAAVLWGNPGSIPPWNAQTRAGKSCLLDAMRAQYGERKAEGYVSYLENLAARAQSYTDQTELSLDWMRAGSSNRMWAEDLAPMALACNSSF